MFLAFSVRLVIATDSVDDFNSTNISWLNCDLLYYCSLVELSHISGLNSSCARLHPDIGHSRPVTIHLLFIRETFDDEFSLPFIVVHLHISKSSRAFPTLDHDKVGIEIFEVSWVVVPDSNSELVDFDPLSLHGHVLVDDFEWAFRVCGQGGR